MKTLIRPLPGSAPRLLSALVGAVLLLAIAPAYSRGSGSGRAIDFEAVTLAGQPYPAAQELEGRVILLDFWATWCGPCIKAMPALNELREEFHDRGFEIVGMTSYSGTAEDIRRFLERREPKYPIVMADSDLIERFSVVGYPTYFLVDRKGQIAEIYVGEIESQLNDVRARIRDLLAD